jgi:hypothetical protein
MDRSKLAAQHETAVRVFQQLLIDFVHSPHVSWDRERGRLAADSRFGVCETLRETEQYRLFHQYVDELRAKAVRQFEGLLDYIFPELPADRLDFNEDILPLVAREPKFHRILRHPPSSDEPPIDPDDREYLDRIIRTYVNHRLDIMRREFQELLHERTDLLTYRFIAAESQGNPDEDDEGSLAVKQALQNASVNTALPSSKVSYEDAVDLLYEDSRYERMRVLSNERERLVHEWLQSTAGEYQRKKDKFQ